MVLRIIIDEEFAKPSIIFILSIVARCKEEEGEEEEEKSIVHRSEG